MSWSDASPEPELLRITGPLSAGARPYVDYYNTVDPHHAAMASQPRRRWVSDAAFVDKPFVRKSEFYNDFLLPLGVRYWAAAHFKYRARRASPVIVISRSSRAGPFSSTELAELDRLAPAFERALLLSHKARRDHAQGHGAASLLQELSFGVILVDATGCIITMNQPAERILASKDGLALERSVVTPARSFERAMLSKALSVREGCNDVEGGAFVVGRATGRLPYSVLVTPAPTKLRLILGTARPIAMILVSDLDSRVETRAETLRAQFGFSGAEAQLAVALARGMDLRHIAADAGKAMPTLRSQLRAIYGKTGVNRQADIVRLVLSLPAVRP